jgi:2-C-methyl-D-erythritol 2,4-cyclodiphosphate synthase
MRVGIGLDFHRFAEGRRLILGGIEIPYERGLAGHSDADVLAHAICDALLGAAGLGDLGTHFPAEDPQYEGISSLVLLKQVREMLAQKGYEIGQIDAVIVAEEPPIAPYLPRMKEALAGTLGIAAEKINLKAKRPEGLGALGRGEGVMAQAVASLRELSS